MVHLAWSGPFIAVDIKNTAATAKFQRIPPSKDGPTAD